MTIITNHSELFTIQLKSILIYCRLLRQTLRPRSGKEYQNIDRPSGPTHPKLHQTQFRSMDSDDSNTPSTQIQYRGLHSDPAVNYVNIMPVPENAESPSPGYQSGDSMQEPQSDTLVCKVLVH